MNKIILHQFQVSESAGIANFSPYCLKIESYLRICHLDYEISWFKGHPKWRTPRGQLPFIQYGDQTIDESEQIIHFLDRERGQSIDAELSTEQMALSTALKNVCEKLVESMIYFRWQTDSGFAMISKEFFNFAPKPIRPLVAQTIRKSVLKSLWTRGIGRLTLGEATTQTRENLTCLHHYLGNQKSFFPNRLHSVDAQAFGILAQFTLDISGQLQNAINEFKNLVVFVDCLNKELFPEFNSGKSASRNLN